MDPANRHLDVCCCKLDLVGCEVAHTNRNTSKIGDQIITGQKNFGAQKLLLLKLVSLTYTFSIRVMKILTFQVKLHKK